MTINNYGRKTIKMDETEFMSKYGDVNMNYFNTPEYEGEYVYFKPKQRLITFKVKLEESK